MAKGQFGPRKKGEPGVAPVCSIPDIEKVWSTGMGPDDVMRELGIKPKDVKKFMKRWRLFTQKQFEIFQGIRQPTTTGSEYPYINNKGSIYISLKHLNSAGIEVEYGQKYNVVKDGDSIILKPV